MKFDTTFCSYGAEGVPNGAESEVFGSSSCNGLSAASDAPFLSNPLDCSDPQPTWKLRGRLLGKRGHLPSQRLPRPRQPRLADRDVIAPPVTGCDDPLLAAQFNATSITTKPLQPGGGPVQADQPAGLAVDLDFPQSNDPTDLNAEVDNTRCPRRQSPRTSPSTLPAGLSDLPLLGRRPRGLLGPRLRPSGRPGPLRRHQAGHAAPTPPRSAPPSPPRRCSHSTTPRKTTKSSAPNRSPATSTCLKPHPGDLPVGGGNARRQVPPPDPARKRRAAGSTSSSPASPPPTSRPAS